MRLRKWVIGLHWGQLIMLLVFQLLIGAALGLGLLFASIEITNRHQARVAEKEAVLARAFAERKEQREAKKAARWDKLVAMGENPFMKLVEEEKEFPTPTPYQEFLATTDQSVEAKNTARFVGIITSMLAGAGVVLWLALWTWATLSLWWWLGALSKPRSVE